MKPLVLLFIMFTQLSIAQIINIPDPNFKAKLLQADVDQGIAWIGSGSGLADRAKIDTNNNGEIEVQEALPIKTLVLNSSNISDLTGIEYFINLESLWPTYNNLTTIDLSTLIQLKNLFVVHNQITSLDISNQTQLIQIDISFNNFSTLDLSSNNNLVQLWCRNNPNLTYINLKNNQNQTFPLSGSGVCWINVPSLSTICADSSEISALQQFLTTCNNSPTIAVTTDCLLATESFETANYNVYPNPTAGILNIACKNDLIRIEFYDSQLRLIKKIDNLNKTLEVDLSSFSRGCYFLKIISNDGVAIKKVLKE
jgi:hypothetical protein